MVISWIVSGLTFVVALVVIIIVAKVLCYKEKKPSELERETRTCEFFIYLNSDLSYLNLFQIISCMCHTCSLNSSAPLYRCGQHICCLIS